MVPGLGANGVELGLARQEPAREGILGVIGQLPAQAVDADLGREAPRQVHLGVAVVPGEQDVAPVEERQVPAGPPFLVRHRAKVGERDVELPALAVLDVALLGRAVDRERHLVDAGVHEAPRLRLGERQAVGARVEVDVREMRLDVLAHLDGALVEERLAVVEEVDAAERRPDFVDHPLEEVEVQHAGLAGVRDAGFRRAARLRARDVAGRRALDEHPRREGARRRAIGRGPPDPSSAAASARSRRRTSSPRRSDPAQSSVITPPVQTSWIDAVRASPSTRWP